MRDGDRAAASGDWVGAYDAYQLAFAEKAKPEAGQAVRDSQVKATEILLRDGKAAVDRGEWEPAGAAYKKLVAMGGEDQSARLELRDHIKKAYHLTIAELLASNPDGAYALALRGRELFGPDPIVDEALDRVHTRFRSRAEELKEQARYAEALGLLNQILEREPHQEQVLALSIDQIKTAWADDLAGQAATAMRRGHPGQSAVLLARAYEIAARSGDLSTAQAQAEAVAQEAKVRVHVKVEGDPGRVRALRDPVRERVEEAGTTVRAGETTSELLVTLNVEKPACTESKSAAPQTRKYIASQIDVPTPESVALQASLEEARAALVAAEAEVAKVQPRMDAAKAAYADVDGAFQKSVVARDEAKRTLERARTNLANQQALLAKLEGQLAAATDDAERKTLQSKVAAIGANVLEWEEEVTEWQGKSDAAAGEVGVKEGDRAPATAELESAQLAWNEVAARRDAAKKRVTELDLELSRTPATMKEDVYETLEYDVITWTRTCGTPASGSAWTKWRSGLEKRTRWNPTRDATDTAQTGHTLAEVREDPKSYPRQDGEDLAAAQADLVTQVTTWILERVTESFKVASDEALGKASAAPDAATDEMVSLYLAAGASLPPETVEAFRAHLKATYGLEKIELLRESPVSDEAPADGIE